MLKQIVLLLILGIMISLVSCKKENIDSTTTTPNQFALTLTPNPDGVIKAFTNEEHNFPISNLQKIGKGVKVYLTITPVSGKGIIEVTGADKVAEDLLSAEVTMNDDKTISVTYEQQQQFSLTLTANPDATIQAFTDIAHTKPVSDLTKIDKDTKIYLTITPITSKVVVNVTGVDAVAIDKLTAEVIMNSDKTISATCVTTTIEQFTLKISKTGTGTVTATWTGGSATDAQLTAGVKIDKSTIVTLTATPDISTPNVVWNSTTSGNTLLLTMDNNKNTLVAFSANPLVYHKITFTATPISAGTLKVYDMKGEVVSDITNILEGAKVRISIIPVMGYVLKTLTGADISTDTTVTMTVDKLITATFDVAKYIVSFNSSGGSAVADIPNVSYYTTILAPTTPTLSGYTFAGWYKEAALTNAWNFATDRVTANTTLYAKWTVNQYTISFNSNGGSTVVNIINVPYNTTITAPTAPTLAGNTFAGWYKEAALTNAWNFATDKVTANTTLYAKWTVNYTVSFNSNGGSAVANIINVPYNTTIATPAAPTLAGNTFAGWYTDPALTFPWNFTTNRVTANITLYAKWKVVPIPATTPPGDGSAGNPYQISTPGHLQWLSELVMNDVSGLGCAATIGKYFKLMNNINMAGLIFTPIGGWGTISSPDGNRRFAGNFNGNGHEIKNLTLDKTGQLHVGLFGYVNSSSNSATAPRITNLGVTGSFKGKEYVGGLIGRLGNGLDFFSYVSNCYATVSVECTDDGYGLSIGGLIGNQRGGEVSNCYATGSVLSTAFNPYAGGLIGALSFSGTVSNCYAKGYVSATGGLVGGLIGNKDGTTYTIVNNSYYDKTTSGKSDTGKGDGKTTTEMKGLTSTLGSAYKNDYASPINSGYPILSWQ